MPTSNVDIKFGAKGLSEIEKAAQRIEALEKQINEMKDAAEKGNALPKVGKGASGAAAGIKAFGASLKAALGPLLPVLAAVGGLTKAFQTLSAQDFAGSEGADAGDRL